LGKGEDGAFPAVSPPPHPELGRQTVQFKGVGRGPLGRRG